MAPVDRSAEIPRPESIDQEKAMKLVAIFAGVVVLGVASLNTANADTEVVSKTVKYGDLDLSGPEDHVSG